MTTSKRLAAFRLAQTPDEDDEIPTPDKPDEDEVPTPMTKKEAPVADDTDTKAAAEAARTEGHAAGFKAATDRVNTVLASEHYAGREQLASTLLANDKMSADEITAALAAAPKATAAPAAGEITDEQKRAAAEEAGRQEMKAELDKNKNSGVDAGASGGGKPDARAESDKVWAKAWGINEGVK